MLSTRLLKASLLSLPKLGIMARPSSDMTSFRKVFKSAKNIVVLTGAGVSAESGIPTFRGSGGLWRKYSAQNLATPEAFSSNPSLVWEFYHHRREVVFTKSPNDAHKAIAECQSRFSSEGKKLTVITQNIDGLHQRAGTKDVIELHGSLSKTWCLKCRDVAENLDSPICPALAGKGSPEMNSESADIPVKDLPHCKKENCGGLLRPYVVWFGENLDPVVLQMAHAALADCDLCLVIGTSSVVYPAAMFAPEVAQRGVPVAEFNVEYAHGFDFHYYFEGPCTKTIPPALAP